MNHKIHNFVATQSQREAAFCRLHKGGAAIGRPPFVKPCVNAYETITLFGYKLLGY